MASGSETATFPIKIEGDASDAKDMRQAMADLDAQIMKSEGRVHSLGLSMRKLRGTTDEVKKAKGSLREKIDAERESIYQASQAHKKLGGALAEVEKRTKEGKDRHEAFAKALSRAGGPVADASEKLDGLSGIVGSAAGPMGLMVAAAAAIVAVFFKVGAAAVSTALDIGRWIIEMADAARSARLLRDALTGSEQQGEAMTSQINALANRIPTSREKIDELAKSLYKAGLGGQTFVDVLNATGRAGAAVGDDLAGMIKSISTRGVLPNGAEGRFMVTLQELRELKSMGLDLAGSFAKSTGQTVQAATQQLLSGRIPLKRGAELLRKAAEQGFSGINAKQMLSIPTIFAKIKESLSGMTRDVNLEPLLQGLAKIGSFFDENTVPGRALKQLITDIGNGISGLGGKAAPKVVDWLEELELSALILELEFLRLKLAWKNFADAVGVQNIQLAAGVLADMAESALLSAVGLDGVVKSIGFLQGVADAATGALDRLAKWLSTKHAEFLSMNWSDVGTNIVKGLVEGLTSAIPSLTSALKTLADKVKETFGFHLQISSPSKVFERYGENTAEGFERGVERGAPAAAAATMGLAGEPPAFAGSRGGSAAARVTHEWHFHVATEAAAQAMRQDHGFLADLTRAVEELNASAGLPVGAS